MLKLLIADDEKIIRETMADFIDWKSLGIELIGTAGDGIEAYNMILDEYPQIVLTDIRMPGLSGMELIQRIRDINRDTRFIILSGHGEFEYAKQAMQYGIRHYLLKPCNEEQIIASVKEIISDYQAALNQKPLLPPEPEGNISKKVRGLTETFFSESEEVSSQAALRLQTLLGSVSDTDFLRQLAASVLIYSASRLKTFNMINVAEFLMKLENETDTKNILSLLDIQLSAFYREYHSRKFSGDISLKIQEYVESHIAKSDLSLKWIAENRLFMNVDYLSRRFRQETGCKFSKYLTDIRVKKAKEFMAASDAVSIQEIADAVGCGNNPQYFSQIFRKNTGMAPSRYMKMLHGQE